MSDEAAPAVQPRTITGVEFMGIATAADELEKWLSANVGTNADWPIEIKADTEATARDLAGRLGVLQEALAPYRAWREKEGLDYAETP